MAINIGTAAQFAKNIPGVNVVSGALALGLGSGPSLVDMVQNPYNPLKGALSRPDPVLTHMWYVELPGYDFGIGSSNGPLSGVLAGAQSSISGGIQSIADKTSDSFGIGSISSGAADSLASGVVGAAQSAASGIVSSVTGLGYEFVEEATLPFRQYSARNLWRAGKQIKVPDNMYTVPNMRLTVYGDADGLALQYLTAWHNAPMMPLKPNDLNGPRWVAPYAAVKRKITAVVLAPDLSKVGYFVYTGAWIESISELQMESAQGQALKYQVDIAVDDVFVTVAGAAGLIQQGAGLASSITGLPFPI